MKSHGIHFASDSVSSPPTSSSSCHFAVIIGYVSSCTSVVCDNRLVYMVGFIALNSTHEIFFSQPISFLCNLFSIIRLSSQETPSVLSQPAWDPRYIASGRIQQKTPFPSLYIINTSIAACSFVATGRCLPSRCLAMNVYSGSAIPAFRRHVTVFSADWDRKIQTNSILVQLIG
jgi:hypothetical protein